jgi:hypothetical protein
VHVVATCAGLAVTNGPIASLQVSAAAVKTVFTRKAHVDRRQRRGSPIHQL